MPAARERTIKAEKHTEGKNNGKSLKNWCNIYLRFAKKRNERRRIGAVFLTHHLINKLSEQRQAKPASQSLQQVQLVFHSPSVFLQHSSVAVAKRETRAARRGKHRSANLSMQKEN